VAALQARPDSLRELLLAEQTTVKKLRDDLRAEQGKVRDLSADLLAEQATLKKLRADLRAEQGKVEKLNNDLLAEQATVKILRNKNDELKKEIKILIDIMNNRPKPPPVPPVSIPVPKVDKIVYDAIGRVLDNIYERSTSDL
jgi:septal ring factor EnvC (AmiA/AmiB activator)